MTHPGLAETALARVWEAPFRVDVRLTLAVHGRGSGDPTYRVDKAGAVWRTSLTPDGPATIRVLPAATDATVATDATAATAATATVPATATVGATATAATATAATATAATASIASADAPSASAAPAGTVVRAYAWGPGASWLLGALPAALGLHDDPAGFDPAAHPVLREVAVRHPGLRLGRSDRLLEALVPAILEQKVTGVEAHRAWRFLLNRFGTRPPGPAPAGMRVFPGPRAWRQIPSWEWHRAGVEGVRARTIRHAATVAESLERLLTLTNTEAARGLRTIPGVGPWTAAETMQRAAGDPDAVSVGDYHLPKIVGWALAGRQATDDAGMLELLAPYAGHRHRVTRLVELSGLGPPRRGPRMPVRDYRRL